jgi:hypothetical protein
MLLFAAFVIGAFRHLFGTSIKAQNLAFHFWTYKKKTS